jgi:hypothetical protein
MLINSNWKIILNKAINIPVQSVNQAALFVQGLNNGWNYYDKFSLKPWTDNYYQYFIPVTPTDNPCEFIITAASIDTNLLQVGDEIAIYNRDS